MHSSLTHNIITVLLCSKEAANVCLNCVNCSHGLSLCNSVKIQMSCTEVLPLEIILSIKLYEVPEATEIFFRQYNVSPSLRHYLSQPPFWETSNALLGVHIVLLILMVCI